MLDHSILGVVETRSQAWNLDDASVYAAAVGGASPAFPITLAQYGGPQLGLNGADMTQVLHAEQSLVMHRPLPPSGVMQVTRKITDIFDKGSGALVVSTWETPYFTTRSSCFVKGEGGFGGPRGPHGRPNGVVPDRPPSQSWAYQTTEDQALRYRETGDFNPMHWDPDFARRAGFERPILHGLCTLGITLRLLSTVNSRQSAVATNGLSTANSRHSAIRELSTADSRLLTVDTRFTAPVYPGQLLTVDSWQSGEFRASTDRVVLVGKLLVG